MDKEEVLNLIKYPNEFELTSLVAITDMIDRYPYFQPLYAIKLKLQNYYGSFQYNTFLKTTGVYTQDRSVLFDFITSEKFHQLDIANTIDLLIEQNREHSNEEVEVNKQGIEQISDPDLFIEKEKAEPNKQERSLDINFFNAHSFQDWMKLTQLEPVDKKETELTINPQFQIIDEFIKNNPKIVPTKSYESTQKIIAKYEPSTHLMTETLAKVYTEQKRYDKAIQAFKILILNNPKKSSYFADRIQEIERLKENKS
jgi:tetratricopeptide (TPR) repeat protein